MLHVNYHIDRLAPDRYGAWFTVHRDKDTDTRLQGVELDQAFTDRLAALMAVIDAMKAHMGKRYNLGNGEFTVEEGL